jgi:CRISPR/Cas system-associated exonuclease Cas4 (RecB family)
VRIYPNVIGTSMPKPYWSYNQLATYLRCPLRYYFAYVLALPRRTVPGGQALGSAVHAALAAYHRSIKDGKPLDADAVKKSFLDAWQERQAGEVIQYGAGAHEEDLLDQGIALLTAYLEEPPPKHILAVEEQTMAPVCNSQGELLAKPLVSVVDLLTRDGTGTTITDFKTAGRSLAAAEAALSLQATCYVHNVSLLYGAPVSFCFTVLVKTQTPRIQHLEAYRTEADLGRLGDLIQSVERAVEAEIFYPVEAPQNCAGCPFRRPCREWTALPSDRSLLPPLNTMHRTESC